VALALPGVGRECDLCAVLGVEILPCDRDAGGVKRGEIREESGQVGFAAAERERGSGRMAAGGYRFGDERRESGVSG
jgi:hypothetical protein